ncbi:SCO family protein [Tumebacillus permanentifrigoris]|uniref:Protein SCO1/2 n=1 Tax=Tumebacillus permanentifrigoris TaxID=378543 RepID=A0A316D4U6_9BACL|nr:SCO family protein [Tumebacillus permanentifrigoris]PWK06994.1 protein SCO1/2 [Tumebacillus permanentifrigoris]
MKQARRKRIRLLGPLILFLLAIASGSWWYWHSENQKLPVMLPAPNFTLQNIDGGNTTFHDEQGKVRLVEFFFANCPDICPLTTANMAHIQDQLKQKNEFGKDVEFVSISFDPERDTNEVLKQYADRLHMDRSGWKVLRGTPEQTAQVADQFGVYLEKQADGTFVHSTRSLYLVDRNNQIRKVYQMGNEMPTDEVYNDILKLVRE